MKFGFRVPSLKKRISARLSWKRVVRHRLGLKAPRGLGILTNPKKALYNKIYHKTTFGIEDLLRTGHKNNIDNLHLSNNEINKGMDNADNLNQRIIRSSSVALTITSGNFLELRQQITNIYNKKVALLKKLKSEKLKFYGITSLYFLSLICIVGFFNKKISNKKKDQKSVIDELNKEISDTFVSIAFADKSQLEKSWLDCVDSFNDLMKSEKVWDLTYSEDLNSVKMRTTAKTAIKRSLIDKSIKRNLDFIKCGLPCLFMPNANGPDLFIFPTFFVFFKNYHEFGIFDLKEITHTLEFNRFIEEEGVPKDSETIDYTWKKANKNGSPDKRFKGNYQIPIVKYGQLFFQSKNGLDEGYMFSDSLSFSKFLESYNFHLSILKNNLNKNNL